MPSQGYAMKQQQANPTTTDPMLLMAIQLEKDNNHDMTKMVIDDISSIGIQVPLVLLQELVYDLEQKDPMSNEYALVKAFLVWRKELERIRLLDEKG